VMRHTKQLKKWSHSPERLSLKTDYFAPVALTLF